MSWVRGPLRQRIDNWRFWMTWFGVALGFCIVVLFILWTRTAKESRLRIVQQRAAAISSVSDCFIAYRNRPLVLGYVKGQNVLIDNSVETTKAALDASSPDDPLRAVRNASLVRLRAARLGNRRFAILIEQRTPTRAVCVALADRMHVPIPAPLPLPHRSQKR